MVQEIRDHPGERRKRKLEAYRCTLPRIIKDRWVTLKSSGEKAKSSKKR